MVQALPVMRLLKKHFPASEIYWWIDSKLAPLLEGDPDLAGVVRFERRRWSKPEHLAGLWKSVRWMRAQDFDWVIDLQGLLRSGAIGWLARGKLLVGLDTRREGARGFYDLMVPRASFHTHAVDWYLAVLTRLGVPVNANFQWLPPQPDVAANVRSKWPVQDGRWLILQPGARWLNKRWPVGHFGELLLLLEARHPELRFAILGGAEDRPLGETIARAGSSRCLDLTGKLSLPEMVEWIRLGEAMVTNDTGPMHVAAALGKPVIALFGPTEPRRTGPYGQLDHVLKSDLPCIPCMSARCTWSKPIECLRAILPDAVAVAVAARIHLSTSLNHSPAHSTSSP